MGICILGDVQIVQVAGKTFGDTTISVSIQSKRETSKVAKYTISRVMS